MLFVKRIRTFSCVCTMLALAGMNSLERNQDAVIVFKASARASKGAKSSGQGRR